MSYKAIICRVDGCESKVQCKKYGLCGKHYQRFLKTGDPLKVSYNRADMKKKYPREYSSWCEMKTRCYNANRHKCKSYMEHGIKVCERWMQKPDGFKNFIEDMGRKPSYEKTSGGHPIWTIDRIDPLGDYCPENCRWATVEQQAVNKSNINTLYISYVKDHKNHYRVRVPSLSKYKYCATLTDAEMWRDKLLKEAKGA